MKNFLILCSIFIFAYLVRFYNFEDRLIFWTEQARSLETSIAYLDKPSLLGQEYFRWDKNSHVIFSGAFFNWALLPVILFTHYDVIGITTFFAFLNIFTGLAIFLVARRYFSYKAAIYSSILFLFSNLMIYHSLFIWNYNLLPLVGVILFSLTLQNYKEFKLNNFLYLGLFAGFGISIQILFVVYAAVILALNLFKSKKIILSVLMFIVGIFIGNLPMFVFDLRHNFYQSLTIWQYLMESLSGRSDASFAYYYLLPLVPVVAISFGWLLSKTNNYLAFVLILMYLYFNLYSIFHIPNSNLTVSQIDYAARIISNDTKGDFNIASDIDFDKRAYALRYLLKYKYNKNILPVTDYSNIQTLYVLADNNYNFKESGTWEIKAGGEYKVKELQRINEKYSLYKLIK